MIGGAEIFGGGVGDRDLSFRVRGFMGGVALRRKLYSFEPSKSSSILRLCSNSVGLHVYIYVCVCIDIYTATG